MTEIKLLSIIAELNGLLRKVRDLGMSLLSIIRVELGQVNAQPQIKVSCLGLSFKNIDKFNRHTL